MDEESNCGNCYFWRQSEPGLYEIGDCRVRPPIIIDRLTSRNSDYSDLFDATSFPVTHMSEWCGEYRHKNRMP